jgi:V/A-type H+-transporting ATPase subunit E
MASDVAAFAKQLREEGIEAAKQESEAILSEARSKAAKIIEEAESAAKKTQQEMQDAVERNRRRSEAELKLVARDLILKIKQQIEQVAAWLLKGKVAEALSIEETLKTAIIEVVKSNRSTKDWEVSLGPVVGEPLAKVVIENLFKEAGAEVKLTEGFKRAGFTLTSQSGSQVIEVSDDSLTDVFRSLLSPELQKMIDQKIKDMK